MIRSSDIAERKQRAALIMKESTCSRFHRQNFPDIEPVNRNGSGLVRNRINAFTAQASRTTTTPATSTKVSPKRKSNEPTSPVKTKSQKTAELVSPRRLRLVGDEITPRVLNQVESKIEYYERLGKELSELAAKKSVGSPMKDPLSQHNLLHQSQIDYLKAELETVRRELAELNEQDALNKEEIERLKSEAEREKAELDIFREEKSKMEAQIAEHKAEWERIHEKRSEKLERASIGLAEIREIREETITEQDHYDEMMEKIRQLLDQQEQQKEAVERLAREDEARVDRIGRLLFAQATTAEEEAMHENQQLMTRTVEQEKIIARLMDELKKKTLDMQQVTELLNEEMADHQELAEETRVKIALHLHTIENLTLESEASRDEIERLKAIIEELQKERDELTQQVLQLQALLHCRDETIARLEQELEQLKEAVDSLEVERDEVLSRLNDCEAQLREKEETEKIYQRKIRSVHSEIDSRLEAAGAAGEDRNRCQSMELELLEDQLNTEREHLLKVQEEYQSHYKDMHNLELFRDFAEEIFERNYEEEREREAIITELENNISQLRHETADNHAKLEATRDLLEEEQKKSLDLQVALADVRMQLHDSRVESELLRERANIEEKLNNRLVRLTTDSNSSGMYHVIENYRKNMHHQVREEEKDDEIRQLKERLEEREDQIETLKNLLLRRKEKNKAHVEQVGRFYQSQLNQILGTPEFSHINDRLTRDEMGSPPRLDLLSPAPVRAPAPTPSTTPQSTPTKKLPAPSGGSRDLVAWIDLKIASVVRRSPRHSVSGAVPHNSPLRKTSWVPITKEVPSSGVKAAAQTMPIRGITPKKSEPLIFSLADNRADNKTDVRTVFKPVSGNAIV
ncbi:hypothetical protein PROFUN_04961 [Planoprotostelium fungivorum]|uniref:Uncharacterized protein n=1 Tax=Planoprotostelium fungivorum TaxID=1890364 RepID=A0A2P6NSP0_9EUKA|nr:hypothetical protein PROFUN_04961 [Planoprotostelium fungivorum]